jgi:hypothetical protein
MGIEAFAEAALSLLPGWHIKAIEDINFLASFKFYHHDSRAITVQASVHPQAEGLLVDCRLVGRRSLPNQSDPRTTDHFTARVRLGKTAPSPSYATRPEPGVGATIDAHEVYRLYFHGPAYRVIEKAWWDGTRMIGRMAAGLTSNHIPESLPTIMSPRLIELCFQTAGLWEIASRSRMGLPQHLDSVTVLAPEPVGVQLFAVVTPDSNRGMFDADVVDANGQRYVHLSGYRTVEVPNDFSEEHLKAFRTMLSPTLIAA